MSIYCPQWVQATPKNYFFPSQLHLNLKCGAMLLIAAQLLRTATTRNLRTNFIYA